MQITHHKNVPVFDRSRDISYLRHPGTSLAKIGACRENDLRKGEVALESQNVEWKEKWRDEYLKCISAFANAQGGVLVIGRNDKGRFVGLEDTAKLMDDLPNKIRNTTGVIADVDLSGHDGKQFITITVKPYPYPISCHGKYYYRSGSTTQELSGSALDEFMLRKQGKTWDGVPVPYVNAGIPVQIKIFSNKVIIYNDGRLPENWSLQNLLETHRSEPCNPTIANVFFRAGMIESWGRGIEKITNTCKDAGQPEPAIEFRHNREFSVTFYSVVGITKKDTKSISINETQNRLLAMMDENPRITVKAMSIALGINERNIKNNIKVLKTTGHVERIGANRGGYWAVKSPD